MSLVNKNQNFSLKLKKTMKKDKFFDEFTFQD